MTGFMRALSHNPGASTDFFNSTDPQDNSKWVLGDRPSYNDITTDALGHAESADDYEGPAAAYDAIGEALVAGATGISPGGEAAQAGYHTDQHRQVLNSSLEHLTARGDDFPAEMRDDMASILTNHGGAVHETMSDVDNRAPLDDGDLMEVTKQISRDQDAHGDLTKGMDIAIREDIVAEEAHPEDSLNRAGRTIGFLEEARYQAIGDRTGDELTEVGWKKNWQYHGWGALANFIPGVGDAVQRGVDLTATGWLEDEQNRINGEATTSNKDAFELRRGHLTSLADAWYKANGDWAEGQTGYSQAHGVYQQIGAAANDGNHQAKGIAGAQ